MSSEILTLVGVILLLILASAFFSSAETTLTAASDARMRQLAGKGNRRARLVERLRGLVEGGRITAVEVRISQDLLEAGDDRRALS